MRPILAVFNEAPANAGRSRPSRSIGSLGHSRLLAEREGELLETTAYRTTASYDALNRIKRLQFPQDVEGKRRELRPIYNNAGGLEKVFLDDTLYVERIAYDAKGQRALMIHCSSFCFGAAPTWRDVILPSLNRIRVGIDWTLYLMAVAWFSSTLSLTILTLSPIEPAISSGRADHPAWAAPFRPEIDHDRAGRLDHVALERRIRNLADGHEIPRRCTVAVIARIPRPREKAKRMNGVPGVKGTSPGP